MAEPGSQRPTICRRNADMRVNCLHTIRRRFRGLCQAESRKNTAFNEAPQISSTGRIGPDRSRLIETPAYLESFQSAVYSVACFPGLPYHQRTRAAPNLGWYLGRFIKPFGRMMVSEGCIGNPSCSMRFPERARMVGPVLHQEMLLGTRRNRLYVFRWIYAGWLLLQVLYFSFAAGMATAFGNTTQTTTIGLSAGFFPVLIHQQIILVFL